MDLRPQIVRDVHLPLAANLEDHRGKSDTNPCRIECPRKRMGMCGKCNPHVYSKMTKEGILRSDYEPVLYLTVAFFFTKNGNELNNGRREFTSKSMRGALLLSVVYQHSP